MKVYELNRDQLDELREVLFWDWSNAALPITKELYSEVWNNTDFPGDLPDEIIYFNYDGIEFAEDDFSSSRA